MAQNGLSLFVELLDSEVSYLAGTKVCGHIFMEIQGGEYDKGKKLTLCLKGFEETEFGTKT